MRVVFIIISFCLLSCVNGQTIRIMDSLIVKKSHQDAVTLNIPLSIPRIITTPLLVNKMPRYVVSDPVVSNALTRGINNSNVGLVYVVENLNGQIIPLSSCPGYPGYMPILPNPDSKDEYSNTHNDCTERRCVLDEDRMKVFLKDVRCDSLKNYDNQSLVLFHSDTVIRIFPLLFDKKLLPGQYKFYLYYCYTTDTTSPSCAGEKTQTEIFYGEIFSNKVDLIVEDRPLRWWQFWRRKSK